MLFYWLYFRLLSNQVPCLVYKTYFGQVRCSRLLGLGPSWVYCVLLEFWPMSFIDRKTSFGSTTLHTVICTLFRSIWLLSALAFAGLYRSVSRADCPWRVVAWPFDFDNCHLLNLSLICSTTAFINYAITVSVWSQQGYSKPASAFAPKFVDSVRASRRWCLYASLPDPTFEDFWKLRCHLCAFISWQRI